MIEVSICSTLVRNYFGESRAIRSKNSNWIYTQIDDKLVTTEKI